MQHDAQTAARPKQTDNPVENRWPTDVACGALEDVEGLDSNTSSTKAARNTTSSREDVEEKGPQAIVADLAHDLHARMRLTRSLSSASALRLALFRCGCERLL